MKRIKTFLTNLRENKSGNALLLVALGAPALIGGAGFAVDTAQWYLWKRELQQAVDQGAYAGAYALAREESEATYETRVKQEYDANLAVIKGDASDPSIRIVDYAGGTDNSIIVSGSVTRTLPFSSFITGTSTTVRASAQAKFAAGGTFNACLISLDEGTEIGGSASVKAKCGLAALSCDDPAITIDGSAEVETDIIVACGEVDVPEDLQGKVSQSDQLFDEYAELDPPTNDTPQTYSCDGHGQSSQASLDPGTYPSIVVSCTTVLSAGIYVIDGGLLDLSANYNVTGTGVMFVLRNGARVKLGGNGNNNSIKLSPMTALDVENAGYPDQADELSDILIFEERDNDPPNPGHILNGNSNSLIEGLIYLPASELTILGTANVSSQCLLISANKITISGGAQVETLCKTDDSTLVGDGSPEVKLVA